jgi:hypothetical protein
MYNDLNEIEKEKVKEIFEMKLPFLMKKFENNP